MKSLFAAILFSLLGSACVHGADPARELASVQHFALGGTGVAGTISQGEINFRQILDDPQAKEKFLGLLNGSNPQARCYALLALRSIAPDIYREKIGKFVKMKDPVSTIGGCMVTTVPMSSVARNIDAGQYDHFLAGKK
jgi:hypothetical protein